MRNRRIQSFGGEGAGGVDHLPAGGEQVGGAVEDPVLPGGAPADICFAPFGQGDFILPVHPFPRAGGVHQHPVETAGEKGGQPLGAFIQDDGVRRPHPLEVLGKDFRPAGDDFVGDKEPPPRHLRRQLGRFAARRGAEVEHPETGPLGDQERFRRRHGRGFLDVIEPGFVEDAPPGAGFRVIGKPGPAPGDGGEVEPLPQGGRKIRRTDFQAVGPEAVMPLAKGGR